MNHDKDGAEDPKERWSWEVARGEEEERKETKEEKREEKDEIYESVGFKGDEKCEEVQKANIRERAINAKAVVVKACGTFLYSPSAVADLFVVGWRCWFLTLKTLETALAVSPRSSPYALDLLCSLKHLSLPFSHWEVRHRLMDNYAAFSGEYFWLLRSLVCCCVCRFASPWRVALAMVFLALCGFLPLEDRRVGPYLMPRDFQRVFLVIVAVCVSGVVDVVAWCLLLACPIVFLHLLLHDSSVSSHRPIFSNLLWS